MMSRMYIRTFEVDMCMVLRYLPMYLPTLTSHDGRGNNKHTRTTHNVHQKQRSKRKQIILAAPKLIEGAAVMCSKTDQNGDVTLQIDEELSAPPQAEPIDSSHDRESTARSVPLIELSLENITYAPSTRSSKSKSRRQVLSNVSTTISPHELSAWMGPSGSGV